MKHEVPSHAFATRAVHKSGNGEGYEVEFVALDGETLAVASVYASQVRPAMSREIPHARAVG